ncbi:MULTISPECIES: glycine/sarcosine/betaine reductase component B subunit [unclassified Clostridioides]|uniref:glycine/sarcosine/betaine reductase component B subunit n=1 Tax=unclassified Clostridioides TaxID=2635829 RepID=UPI0006BBEE31|nr:proline reductase [Clostridioides difficile]MCC0632156.1 proline reductase [Clostridioides sp. ZZV15-6388]MCC0645596.1 proline reductase [Clostridioides sp. ZZV14-6150]MCC0647528.1 proline reductase [Clostridioides sp. ZZV15-6598]MCC0660554.1 proline reductase [Clostridioides sp. ZZV14-6154]MCC0665459.1 proline reductase [Clostridioides sp. ZZV15-6597]MCC0669567.1 proline reductase [Clostridioides sp. ZZV14-6153]MCC0704767.1 proline reductase [Clostridioides sp. ES-S-0049-02]MCC0718743.1
MGIGPSTKETSLHHFRDPLLDIVESDKDVDLLGVIVVGTPDGNENKTFVGQRTAAWLEAMRVDGAIVSSDGWGNSHVDYANTFEEIGKRDIPVVGVTFNGTQAKFVVSNQYMNTIVDMNKSKEGIETEVVGENNTNEIDAKKALAFLKLKMRKHG